MGAEVKVGPFCIIEDGVTLGDGCIIGPNCVIRRGVTMGVENTLDIGVVLGGAPQDVKYAGEESFVHIGDRNRLREYVTIHRATGEGAATQVGDDNFLMAYAHLGHNVRIGSNIMLASYAGLSGHCTVEDRVIIGGLTGLHQYVTVGRMCMIGGHSRITRDIPPFVTAQSNDLRSINVIGLQRNGVSSEEQTALREAFRMIHRSKLNVSDAIAHLREDGPLSELVTEFVEFIERMDEGCRGRQQS